ncbi:MAG: RimK-like ATPgrasp N-terminal domain-containing protein [candidate division Zixibacteria bacterium]|nr:RimK-like ATPgrasp N-terminal domain-containing protein [candidate division Zixibacteria bacterium]
MATKGKTEQRRFRTKSYIAFYNHEQCHVNISGNYDYMELPYYLSQDLENDGKTVRPTCKEMLDAYITPLALEKARLAGIPAPEFYLTNSYFEPPVVIDSINPFMIRSRVVHKNGMEKSVAKSLTRNFKYAMCCQEIPPEGEVKYFRSVLGWTTSSRYRAIAADIWNTFHIPLARIRVIVTPDERILFSDISKLPLEKLTKREMAFLQEQITWEE